MQLNSSFCAYDSELEHRQSFALKSWFNPKHSALAQVESVPVRHVKANRGDSTIRALR